MQGTHRLQLRVRLNQAQHSTLVQRTGRPSEEPVSSVMRKDTSQRGVLNLSLQGLGNNDVVVVKEEGQTNSGSTIVHSAKRTIRGARLTDAKKSGSWTSLPGRPC